MARIAIIEDDRALRDELAALMVRNAHEPVVIDDFVHAAAHVLKASVQLVLLDLSLPGADGATLCREIRANSPVPIIILTSNSSETNEVLTMSLGADDFIAKPYSPNILLARIDAVLRRSFNAIVASIEHRNVSLDPVNYVVTALDTGKSTKLPNNEGHILSFLMKNAGMIIERSALAAELWDSELFVDDNTLSINISRLRRSLAKIGVHDFLTTHRGQGYSV
ncbi:MAG: response regulator transcription factor [Actinomycetaceae bacterium]|nr:response regulator transcription factor [Actinomycetaceae bacterium]